MTTSPSLWIPQRYDELIGPAAETAEIIEAKIERMHEQGNLAARWLFSGDPGVGKSALARIAANDLAGGERLLIESLSGLSVTIDVVRGWIQSLGMGSLFSANAFQVKLIEELDRMPVAAQDLMLDYLDRTRGFPDMAFIGTSNADVEALQKRFQTRLQYWPIAAPSQDAITKLLLVRAGHSISEYTAQMISAGSCGNVRQALLDLESELDVQFVKNRKLKKAA